MEKLQGKTDTKENYNFDISFVSLDDNEIKNILMNNCYEYFMNKADNADVNIYHLENIFTDETYYLAMKIVPLIERKVLYLSYIENARLNEICKILKLQEKDVIQLRNKGLIHFKNNLNNLYKIKKIKGGKKDE